MDRTTMQQRSDVDDLILRARIALADIERQDLPRSMKRAEVRLVSDMVIERMKDLKVSGDMTPQRVRDRLKGSGRNMVQKVTDFGLTKRKRR